MDSPDKFFFVRLNNNLKRASNFQLQLSEFKSHSDVVQEYRFDFLNHLLDLESITRPNLAMIKEQPEINLNMRPLLLDYLMDVIDKMNMCRSIFPSTVNLIDRYCSARVVKKEHYQLVGLTCLWISSKSLDAKLNVLKVKDLGSMCCNVYRKELFLGMENHILSLLNWNVTVPTFDLYIDLYLHLITDTNNVQVQILTEMKVLSIYICELVQFYPEIHFGFNSSKVSVAAFITSIIILNLNFDCWAFLKNLNNLVKQEGQQTILDDGLDSFTQEDISMISDLIVMVLDRPPPSLKMKYFDKNFKFSKSMEKLKNYASLGPLPPTPFKDSFLPPSPSTLDLHPLLHNLSEDMEVVRAHKFTPY